MPDAPDYWWGGALTLWNSWENAFHWLPFGGYTSLEGIGGAPRKWSSRTYIPNRLVLRLFVRVQLRHSGWQSLFGLA